MKSEIVRLQIGRSLNVVTLKTFKDTDANKNLIRCKNAKDMFNKLGI